MSEFNKIESASKSTIDTSQYTFTKGQQEAINGIIEFIGEEFNPNKFIIGLTGAGGVGKTFITKYIITHCKYSLSTIKCASTTHKACRVFSQAIGNIKEVHTIQSILGLRLDLKLEDFNPNNPQFNPMGSVKLENTKLLIIDEASMLPAKLVTYICNKCKDREIKIIMCGDASQLAPVNEHKSIAFVRCFKIYTLTEIVRQGSNNPINFLLDILRKDISNKTTKFLNVIAANVGKFDINDNNEGYYILKPTEFTNAVVQCFSNPEYTKNIDMYKVIAYTNAKVNNWNTFIRNLIIKDSEKNIITKHDLVMSYETIVDDFLTPIIHNSEEYIINDIVNFVDSTYGFKGFIVKFQLVHGGKITKPLFIIDHKDKYSVTRYYQVINNLISEAKKATGATRSKRWTEYYAFKKKYLMLTNICNASGNIVIQRDIDYGFAITSHRSQGSTYNNVFVDINDMIFTNTSSVYGNIDDMLRRLYVACSRTKNRLYLCYGKD